MYRIWIEEVLGFRLRGDRFTVEPAMPADWPGFELTYRHGSTIYEITVSRQDTEAPAESGVVLELDGEAVGSIPVEDTGGTHRVSVRLAPQKSLGSTAAEPREAASIAGQSLQPLSGKA